MPHFLWYGKYTTGTFKKFIDKPEDRSEVARKHIENAGGKMHAFYYVFGEDDIVILCEFPDHESYAATIMAVAAGGALSGGRTTVLMTAEEGMHAMSKAGPLMSGYKLPGG